MSVLDSSILADWSALGITWATPPARRMPDVEQLISRSLAAIPGNARLLVLATSWISIYWRCVGRDRLLARACTTTSRDQATLGIMLETADTWLPVPVFKPVIRRLQRVIQPEPLLDMNRSRPALARLAEVEASTISKRWGLWCLPIERKLDAIRPVAWVMKNRPSLCRAALFKGTLKTSLLSALRIGSQQTRNITQLAAECGVTRKAVYDALEDMRFCGLVGAHNNRHLEQM